MRFDNNYKITDLFGKNVFTNDVMRSYVGEVAYAEFRQIIDNGRALDLDLANKIAEAMKDWAMSNGATHYTHWFQPLTGTTAEKHDSFISIDKKGNTILEFSGKNLLKGETDASSFPSGGIRATFEARGYTMWDCSSPAFIKTAENGAAILYIPTAFCSYNGEALDKKTPLLRSMDAINRAGVRLMRALGEYDVKSVYSNVGGEQEYFLIDKNHYEKRTDLRFCGRTLFGALPPKGQEQNDQYYAIIKDRVASFMSDLNEELWKLGITAKTQHNEVAPAQHELAPIFCTANIATDHNQLIMETMRKVATKHDLACLLHEKPFAGINGSGKHNNWSLSTDTGINLLKPKSDAAENAKFLLVFMCVIAAVDEYGDLIRMSASNAGNEFRLGGHEAPPAIISVYVGDDMEQILENLEHGQNVSIAKQHLQSGIAYLSGLFKDSSDRNRTSPFAFTGNKFEFRMVGSSATLSNPNTILNTIVAEYFMRSAEVIENRPQEMSAEDAALMETRRLYKEHKKVIYSGNNYTKEWQKEAKRRGLFIIDNCVDAYDTLIDKKNIEVFEKHGVLSKTECTIRREIYLDSYVKTYNTEALTMISMATREILPAVLEYQAELAKNVACLKAVNEKYSATVEELLDKISPLAESISYQTSVLKQSHALASRAGDSKKQAILYRDQILPAMRELREVCDKAEAILPKNKQPFPDYADILFYE